MSHNDRQSQDVIARQETVLRLAERDHGLTLAMLSAETHIPIATLASYKNGTAMPLHNAVKLARVLPDHLVSLWFETTGKVVVETQGDEHSLLGELLAAATAYSADHAERIADGVICHRDKAALVEHARKLASIAGRVAL